MDFKPIKAKKIYEEIIEQIKVMITRGELNPGDKLLPERELAEKLQVGRAAVREAYRALEAIGIIEIRPGEGTFVREMGSKPMTDIMSLAVITGKDTLFELLELRKIVEVEAAGLAALRRTEDHLGEMKRWLNLMKEEIDQGSLGDVPDTKFHYAITNAACNSLLTRTMNSISETIKQEMKTILTNMYRTPGTPQQLYEQHKRIFEEIASGNEMKARTAMFYHLDRAEKILKKEMTTFECKLP
ncbi:FadR/GntR family transcriptional regulator [Desulforamulus ruminis]|uniref:FadR/GntR family transcriptional regulator n=1 Tax=Desulforamulus ruminis TaxID=1564 RepID=UPI0023575DE7|nr:FadR/GntR family transcriptional regulator [Desulforamulus ruminis]